ncbi:MAG TPA: DUF1501 domain-containing protein [Pyrinomonadaceae bacterium]|nr:DUF1501 domain-containing protein [Pyrinomonadaceae bacterium]
MKKSRREFLKKTGCALSMTALATQMRHFGLMSAMAQSVEKTTAAAPPSDYRALVCIYLAGGNDGNNSVIPLHNDETLSTFDDYYALRNPYGLAFQQGNLLPINVPRINNRTYGLHPAFGVGPDSQGLYGLWGTNKLAIVTNVGTLMRPTTKQQMYDETHPKPYALFSHSDQTLQHQSGRSDRIVAAGWAGLLSDQRNAVDNPGALVPMITSIAGAQLFTAGVTTLPLAIAPASVGLNEVLKPVGYDASVPSQAQLTALNALRAQDTSTEILRAASHVTDQAITVNNSLQSYQEITVPFPTTSIGSQLKQVARIIKKRNDLNVKRQIFFVQLGGFDTHTLQLATHNTLISQTSQAMRCFYDEMVVQGLGDKVTQFTLSDFNRTMNPAGTGAGVGSDHAWGNFHFVVGGVTAADFFGINTGNGTPYPILDLDGPDDAQINPGARGRWIPTSSVEQYAATLARWFGLPEANFSQVFPGITNFPVTDLGFMQPPAS